jgi:uroporphyrinogen-III synthase
VSGGRVLVTRTQAEPLAGFLRELGLLPVHLPLVMLRPTGTAPPGDRPPPQGAIVTSASAARLAPEVVDWLQRGRVVAVGEATACALREAGIEPAVVAEGSGASALELSPTGACFVGALEPAPALRSAIESGRVTHWPVYERASVMLDIDGLPTVSCVTLASPSAAAAWAGLGVQKTVPVAVIGPTTQDAALRLGLLVGAVSVRPSMQGLALAARKVSQRLRG